MSITREMKVQRSIGKKILAVVAGVGIAAGGLTFGAAPAVAYDGPGSICGSGTGETQEEANAVAEKVCDDKNQVVLATEPGPRLGSSFTASSYGTEKPTSPPLAPPPNDDGKVDEDLPTVIDEPAPVPAPCWSNNNCPVGGAIQTAVPQYMIAGVPQQLVVYAAWRPDENTAGAPTNGDAVISMDGEPIAAAPFEGGVATFNFTPKVPGLKEVTISGVLNSNTSGANAWIDSVEAATMVLPYDPELLEEVLKNKKVEVGDTYTLEEIAQAKTALGKRLEWRVAQDSKDVCAVTTTKKGEVRAKFTESGKCSIIWTDPKKDEEGKYTFKVTA